MLLMIAITAKPMMLMLMLTLLQCVVGCLADLLPHRHHHHARHGVRQLCKNQARTVNTPLIKIELNIQE